MKVIVLGGAGRMGSRTVEDLAAIKGIELVTIADRDTVRSRKLVERLDKASAEVRAVTVDANDRRGIVEAIRGNDVAASALGPFQLFETRLIGASLEAGVDYISMCDDWSTTQDTIIRFDSQARERGLFVVSGCGACPGMSNIAVRYLSDRLDSARKVDIYAYVPMDADGGEAAVKDVLYTFGTVVPVFRESAVRMLPAGSIRRRVQMPGVGAIKVYNVGHGEPVTLPRHIPELEEVNKMMGLGRGTGAVTLLARMGAFGSPRRVDLAARIFTKISKPRESSEPQGALRVEVSGEKDGKPTTLTICGAGKMRETTGIPLAIGARLLAARELTLKSGGVYGPEACFDPATFIRMLGIRGVYAYSNLEMTERVEEGFEPVQVPAPSPARA